jgi:hypothetical protein
MEVRGILKRASDNPSPEMAAGRGGKRRKVSFQLDASGAAALPPPPSSSSSCAAPAAAASDAEAAEVATEATLASTEEAAAVAVEEAQPPTVYEPLRGNTQPVHTLFTGMPNGQKQLWKQAVGMLRVTTVGQLASLPLHCLQSTPLTAATVLRRLQVGPKAAQRSAALVSRDGG